MIVLGSTGSIGVNTLNIARKFNLEVEVLVAGNNIDLLNSQIREFNPKIVVVASKEIAKNIYFEGVRWGEEAIGEAIEEAKSDLVVNALVGFLGLKPTLRALRCQKKVALANKESLVAAGKFLDISKIVPIDSEHFGLWYALGDKKAHKMTITASGGAFRNLELKKLCNSTANEALKHPNWNMGRKITIDSATMTNKIFELLEARWLFGKIKYDAIIETKSIIHAIVDFIDGSALCHAANADMKLPISFALMGKIDEPIVESVDFVGLKTIEFREILKDRYPIWEIKEDLLQNPWLGVVVNAANEVAVDAFLNQRIGFCDIAKITINAYAKFHGAKIDCIEDIFELDKEVRIRARG